MDLFKEIILKVSLHLKQMGFTKKGNNFYLEAYNNFGIINFQRSQESTKEKVRFTMNFGVHSDLLSQSKYDYNISSKPVVEQCHWLARAGDFMTGTPDFWWEVNTSGELDKIVSNVIDFVQNTVLPEINKRLSDEGLINCWTSESFAGTTEIGRFKYVTTLLKAKGDLYNLNRVVQNFMQNSKGKPNSILAAEHLKEIAFFK